MRRWRRAVGGGVAALLAIGALAAVTVTTSTPPASAYQQATGTGAANNVGTLRLASGTDVQVSRVNNGGAIRITGARTLASKGALATDYSPQVAVGRAGLAVDTNTSSTTSGFNAIGSVRLDFGYPVTNPRIHVAGIGGNATNGVRFHTRMRQTAPAGDLTNGTGTMHVDANTFFRADSADAGAICHSSAGGCGSAQLNGTSRTFDLFNWIVNNGTLSSAPLDEYVLNVTVDEEFGDAPTSYDGGVTTSAVYAADDMNLGARSTADNVTVENATRSDRSNADATGDADDAFTGALPVVTAGRDYTLTVPVGGVTRDARVCGYIDFDGSGTFDADDEKACADVAAGATTAEITWPVPETAVSGASFLRLRLGSAGNGIEAPTGRQQDGEIEDHRVTIQAPAIVDSKSAVPASGTSVTPGQEVTYTLTFTNDGSGSGSVDKVDDLTHVLDDAEVTSPPVASDPALTVSAVEDGRYSISGDLAAGQTVTVTYTVRVLPDGQRGDNQLGNFLLPPGEAPPEEPGCAEGDEDCTYHPVPEIVDSKSAVPASGTSVTPGQEVTYTLTFTNDGSGSGSVDKVDDLTHVLDDAEVTSPPVASDPALTVSAVEDGRYSISGDLAAGQTVTVTYTVRVLPDGQRGDNQLGNFLLPPGEAPPEDPSVCEADSEDCTFHPVPEITVVKGVDPADGSTVEAGDVLTYTLTFGNDGATAGTVDMVDDLSHVLDDAEVTTAPASSDEALTVSEIADGRFTIQGTLQPGQTVTVTYAVTVLADGERGDDQLANFVLAPGEEPPGSPDECAEGDPRCTFNPVPEIKVAKAVDPADGSTVAAGDVLTYTLTFANDGAAAGTVDEVDDLTHVIDDAEVTSAPASSDDALTVSEIADGQFTIEGTLQPGQTVTVTYAVTVLADGERGDDQLGNFLLEPGEEPPGSPDECAEGDPRCTFNPVPEISVVKDVDPADGSTVEAGDVLTYTLTFANDGAAAGEVDSVDDLSHVVDDAEVTSAPASSDEALTVSAVADGQFTIQGTLQPGQTVTVTYAVTVLPDGERGDHQLGNFLLAPGEEPPGSPEDCEEDDPTCTYNPVPALSVAKGADTSAVSDDGQSVTYTVQATNVGAAAYTEENPAVVVDDLSGVLDDAVLDEASITADVGGAPTYAEPQIHWSGALGVGETVTITYVVTYEAGAGNAELVNVAFGPSCGEGDPTCSETPPPPPACDPADENGLDPVTGEPCARVEIPASNLLVSKSADPEDGSTVMAGEEITYTVTFENTGSAAARVDGWTDHVSGVLDDAEVTAQPAASSGDLTVTSIEDGAFSVSGSVPAGETVTVSYTVAVLADGERGDDLLANFVTPPGAEPPAECAEGDVLCTTHPVPEVTVAKGVDPADGSTVQAGGVLTYTLTFGNDGAAPGEVDEVDDLSHVIDDAEVTSAPVSSEEALTVSAIEDGRFTITGTLQPGQTVTVTYEVTVLADGERGDDQLGNFLLTPGEEPPGSPEDCEEGDPRCTYNPVPEVAVVKDVNPVDGSTVRPGDVLTYTLTFGNDGAAAGTVDEVDDLTHVIDDAEVTSAPVSSEEALTVSAVDDGRFTVQGTLQPGQTATVTYEVTVLPDGERGDDQLGNFLLEPGEEPPGSPEDCEEGDPRCTYNPVPEITVAKAVDPADGSTVKAGEVLTYTLTFGNDGAAVGEVNSVDDLSHVIDDAEVTSAPVSSDEALTVSAVEDGRFTITGTLQPGQTVTVTYEVTVLADGERGDDRLGNFLLAPGEDPPGSPEDCEEGDPRCTYNPVPEVTVAKAVDPADGSTVKAGDVLTYTITFANDGAAAGTVDEVDDLTHVIDDAEVTSAPVSSDEALTVSAVEDGRFTVQGTLQPGQTVTVTYAATVSPDGERGDDQLGNFLLAPGEDPPGSPEDCEEGDPRCTYNPVPEITVAKDVDPADGSTIKAGEVLTYTLTFGNDGAAAGAVDEVDDLSHVLDDAEVTSAPVASDEALTVSEIENGRFTIKGTLQPGQTVTVTYQVTVSPDGERGDDQLANHLIKPGQQPPGSPQGCAEGDPRCTYNPVPEVSVAKDVDPTDGSTVEPGDVLTYTLTFNNDGAAVGDVDEVDDLSHVLDDAEMTTAPTSSDEALTVSEVADGQFTIQGSLQAGQTVTVTYQVTVLPDGERGDDQLGNFLLVPGEEPPGSPADCEEGDPRCTYNPVTEILDEKSADPASGSTVRAGDVITYTLTFTNTGAAAGSVDRVDHLTHLLDDAEVTSQPESSDGALTVSEIEDGRFTIQGTLEADQTVTVTYQVTVLQAGERGDHRLGNFLMEPGEDPPGSPEECEEGEEDCTVHVAPRIVDSKSADPASGATVAPGQVVTYTLTFENQGAATGEIDKVDDLTHVLDDAEIVTEPTSSVVTVQVERVSETQLAITGTLEPGATATITYQVKVAQDGDGDLQLANFLLPPGQEPPSEPVCEEGSEDCTSHPVPAVTIVKSADPASGSEVGAGDTITYSLTLENTGKGEAEVAFTDHMGGVLDDAELVDGPAADGESVTTKRVGDTIELAGSIAAGKTVVVSYTVEVLAFEKQGDHMLGNFVTVSGQEPPAACVDGSTLCTTHDVPKPPAPPAPPGQPGGPDQPGPLLPDTGGPISIWLLVMAGLLVAGGAGMLIAQRRRRL